MQPPEEPLELVPAAPLPVEALAPVDAVELVELVEPEEVDEAEAAVEAADVVCVALAAPVELESVDALDEVTELALAPAVALIVLLDPTVAAPVETVEVEALEGPPTAEPLPVVEVTPAVVPGEVELEAPAVVFDVELEAPAVAPLDAELRVATEELEVDRVVAPAVELREAPVPLELALMGPPAPRVLDVAVFDAAPSEVPEEDAELRVVAVDLPVVDREPLPELDRLPLAVAVDLDAEGEDPVLAALVALERLWLELEPDVLAERLAVVSTPVPLAPVDGELEEDAPPEAAGPALDVPVATPCVEALPALVDWLTCAPEDRPLEVATVPEVDSPFSNAVFREQAQTQERSSTNDARPARIFIRTSQLRVTQGN
jgi:hypothetical protein